MSKLSKRSEAETSYQVHPEYIFGAASLPGQNQRLTASSPLSIPPSSLFLLCMWTLSVYLFVSPLSRSDMLLHLQGVQGDMIGLGDFGFLATAVKLHSDDETVVQLSAAHGGMLVSLWLCVRLKRILTDERACKCASLAPAHTSSR